MEERVGPQMSDVMFDLSKTTFCVPITDKHSPIAYSIVNEVHSHHPDVKHLGVETILRHVQLVAHVIGGRELVKKYAKYCTRCKILNKNVVKVIMGPSHESQLKVIPAFIGHRWTCSDRSYDLPANGKPLSGLSFVVSPQVPLTLKFSRTIPLKHSFWLLSGLHAELDSQNCCCRT